MLQYSVKVTEYCSSCIIFFTPFFIRLSPPRLNKSQTFSLSLSLSLSLFLVSQLGMVVLNQPPPTLPHRGGGAEQGKTFAPIIGARWGGDGYWLPRLKFIYKIPLILIIFQKYPSHIYFLLCIMTLCYFASQFSVK